MAILGVKVIPWIASNPDLFLKLLALIAVGIGGSVALWRYLDASAREFRKPFWERQVSWYFEAAETAATIACSADEALRAKATDRFRVLYYGPMPIVEDQQVEAAMVAFRNALQAFAEGTGESRAQLQSKSLELADACRRSLSNSWRLSLKALTHRGRS